MRRHDHFAVNLKSKITNLDSARVNSLHHRPFHPHFDEFVEALQAHSIQTLVDIRSFPMSRRLPHFNRESLEKSLPAAGIRYVWMKELGGRRKNIRE